jgi:NAD(P)H-dependent FMN reductase
MLTVVAISGSRREDSSTRKALEVVLSAAREAGTDTDLLNLARIDLLDVPELPRLLLERRVRGYRRRSRRDRRWRLHSGV